MLSQTGCILVVVLAERALKEGRLFSMLLQVLTQVGAGDEMFGADGTLVGLFTRMDALVPNQIRNLAEFLLALATLVWLYFVVNTAHVLL